MGILLQLKSGPQIVHHGDHQKGPKMAHLRGVEGPKYPDFQGFLAILTDFKAQRAKYWPGPQKMAKISDFGTKSPKWGIWRPQA